MIWIPALKLKIPYMNQNRVFPNLRFTNLKGKKSNYLNILPKVLFIKED